MVLLEYWFRFELDYNYVSINTQLILYHHYNYFNVVHGDIDISIIYIVEINIYIYTYIYTHI